MDIHYQGFHTKLYYASQTEIFYGVISVGQNIIVGQGKSPAEAELAIQEAINQYLAMNQDEGDEPM